ncbi:hypothetical protein M231_00783 [Tremella mesenterica]|uniref:Uncharacterized protein n=1 Tax=Tremella mesenterica TaxID=5217 RepID=A0A4Q1BV81_TREME|nr:hypothetical protein M231_00783 [Tremella mesenterica]
MTASMSVSLPPISEKDEEEEEDEKESAYSSSTAQDPECRRKPVHPDTSSESVKSSFKTLCVTIQQSKTTSSQDNDSTIGRKVRTLLRSVKTITSRPSHTHFSSPKVNRRTFTPLTGPTIFHRPFLINRDGEVRWTVKSTIWLGPNPPKHILPQDLKNFMVTQSDHVEALVRQWEGPKETEEDMRFIVTQAVKSCCEKEWGEITTYLGRSKYLSPEHEEKLNPKASGYMGREDVHWEGLLSTRLGVRGDWTKVWEGDHTY